MIRSFSHACLVVRDLERSLGFYRDILGLKVARGITIEGDYPDKAFAKRGVKINYVKMLAAGQREGSDPFLELHYWIRPRKISRPNYNHISFNVKDLVSEYKRLKKRGVRFISPPATSPDKRRRLCFAFDPDNNLIEFIEDIGVSRKKRT
ncbi:MAG: VOC family protein [Candidatus Omnitrophica bacterium]|nr:VOC family protein [Candidatus Omnitrophota bacterium]